MLSVKEILFPKFCFGCGFLGAYICYRCQEKLIRSESPICFYCRQKSIYGLTHTYCRHENGVDGLIYIYKYNGFLKKIIKSVKYKGATECLKELMALAFIPLFDSLIFYKRNYHPLLQPIPIHKNRFRKRGFNQSEIIADYIKESFSIEKTSVLEKVIKTGAQAGLDRHQRLENLKNSFSITGNGHHKSILLVDDVMTTGATLAEAAKTLKQNGVGQVFAFALAKG